ncbi:MAG: hypothetical protein EBX41_10710 [Chitinophagia bacterium]|nr:hypothetical protein [Chitinophagia bacterium]
MADVSITNLSGQVPSLTDVFPFSTTGVTPATYKASLSQLKTSMGFATVATTGSYSDLINTPPVIIQSLIASNNTQLSTTTNNSYQNVVSVTIVPKFANSKINITGSVPISMQGINGTTAGVRIIRSYPTANTVIHSNPNAVYYSCATANEMVLTAPVMYTDTPGTTSSITYTIQFFRTSTSGGWGSGLTRANTGGSYSYLNVQELTV